MAYRQDRSGVKNETSVATKRKKPSTAAHTAPNTMPPTAIIKVKKPTPNLM
jgi:hypothetical protein